MLCPRRCFIAAITLSAEETLKIPYLEDYWTKMLSIPEYELKRIQAEFTDLLRECSEIRLSDTVTRNGGKDLHSIGSHLSAYHPTTIVDGFRVPRDNVQPSHSLQTSTDPVNLSNSIELASALASSDSSVQKRMKIGFLVL